MSGAPPLIRSQCLSFPAVKSRATPESGLALCKTLASQPKPAGKNRHKRSHSCSILPDNMSQGLLSLDDDALCSVLSFLSIAEGRSGPGGTSKALRQAVASNQLARARATAPYVLRGDTHGVVHSLATSFGTAQWRKRSCKAPSHGDESMLSPPPQKLEIQVERLGKALLDPEHDRSLRSSIVDPHLDMLTTSECMISPGSSLNISCPFCYESVNSAWDSGSVRRGISSVSYLRPTTATDSNGTRSTNRTA